MRLHQLELTAFGPFAETVSVDFDALGQAGLFLLTGNTGAGKTSLLDAICFGLYGQVPGDRQQAGHLRSDHAAPATAPRVELIFSAGDKRLRFVRSPAWQRPKARGCGTTLQPASAVASQWGGAGWETLSTRVQEVAQVATDVLGMDVHQFTQVVMLPQGRFSEFLRAGADSRKAVLERLFGTARYRSVERWLVDHRQDTGRRSDELRTSARTLVDQVAAVAEAPAPDDDWSQWSVWAGATLHDLTEQASVAERRAQELDDLVAAQRVTLAAQERRRELQAAGLSASVAQRRLGSRAEEIRELRLRLQRADRAGDVIQVVQRLAAAEQAVTAVERELREAQQAAEAVGVAIDTGATPRDQVDQLDATRVSLSVQTEQLRALWDDAERCTALTADMDRTSTELQDHRARLSTCELTLQTLPRRSDALRRELADAEVTAARCAPLTRQLSAAREVLSAATAVPAALAAVQAAELAHQTVIGKHNDARDARNDLRDRRLDGAAAWLAGQLRAASPCPVCGSCSHPSPATGVDAVPTAAEEMLARRTVDELERERAVAAAAVHGAGAALLALRTRTAGAAASAVQAEVAALEVELAGAEQAAARLPPLRTKIAHVQAQQQELQDLRAVESGQVAVLRERLVAQRAARDELAELLQSALGDAPDIERESRRVEQAGAAVVRLREILRRRHDAEMAVSLAREHSQLAFSSSGFGTRQEVQQAVLPDEQRDQLHSLLESYDAEVGQAARTLADPHVQSALDNEPPDVEGSRARLTELEDTRQEAIRGAGTVRGRAQQVGQLVASLQRALNRWAPAREQHEVADAMAGLAEGKSADNTLRMSLSAFVLSTRLGQVVDAANERLGPMTSGRYLLEYTVEATAGDRQRAAGGLGLRVLDTWTGYRREPKTLSGGEMFQASLSLALGLSDVVSAESGGASLSSLFVDEGFGSLDPDSLDEVMDVLDGLRSGGRVVGVVSHVDAMRERIPAQIRVSKGRTGSTVLATR